MISPSFASINSSINPALQPKGINLIKGLNDIFFYFTD